MQTTITKIKQQRPLVLNITNDVTVNFIANGLLSLGASPIMTKAAAELADLLRIAHALVINIGTADNNFMELTMQACAIANKLGKPIIFDPVGAGASAYRTELSLELLNNYKIAILRGNANEIMALTDRSVITKGVDASDASNIAITHAQTIVDRYDCAVVISGATDIIVDHAAIDFCHAGSPLMPMTTGTGCLLTAVIGAFHAVEPDRFLAATMATQFYGTCGAKAASIAAGPGSWQIAMLDVLYSA